jgi:subtilisin family serine protease
MKIRVSLRTAISLALAMIQISLFTPGLPTRAQGAGTNLYLPEVSNAQETALYLSDEVVIKLFRASDLAGIAVDHALDPVPLDQFGSRPIFRLQILDGAVPLDKAGELAADPRVEYAEPNFLGQAPEGVQKVSWAKGGDSGEYGGQWAVDQIRLPEAQLYTRGAGVTVAVLDTGVEGAHPALAGRLVPGFDFVDFDSDPSEVGNHIDHPVFGHGTHVAGLVALAAPEARIMPLRVLDPDGIGNIWVIAEALAFSVNPDGNPNTPDGAKVINISLSTTRQTDLLAEIVEDVTCLDNGGNDDGSGGDDDDDGSRRDDDNNDCLSDQGGAVVVAAVGNAASSTREYPAGEGISGVLAVGASTQADTLASFSNYGPWVHVLAPGENILSSVPGGEYGVWSGTSMASPLAAGVAALVRATDPGLDSAAVVEQIISSSVKISGPIPVRIDAAAALELFLEGDVTCTAYLGAITVDNLIVPEGFACTLAGTIIAGNIKVESGAILNASNILVGGNLQADGAASVNVNDSTVGGSLQVVKGGANLLSSSFINGDVRFFGNKGGITISNNTIRGNLQCKENDPAPTGGGNIVQGNKEDQCSGL